MTCRGMTAFISKPRSQSSLARASYKRALANSDLGTKAERKQKAGCCSATIVHSVFPGVGDD